MKQSRDQGTCQQHSHSLDESDANKRNSFLRILVGHEVAKGYNPSAIIRSLNGNGRAEARARLIAVGGAYLTRQDVINAGLTWRLANPNRLWVNAAAKDDATIQALEALEQLDSQKWLAQQISAISLDKVQGRGIVFADPISLRRLSAYGHLTLIDSTHKTNQLEWKLFTLMTRDHYACWHPVAHGLLSNEFGELIAEFLLAIKQWCPWPLRHVLSDDSAAEQRAFRLAFPGLVSGEAEISHLLCRVHCMRTIKRRLGTSADSKSRGHLMAALCSRRTRIGARDSVDKAIAAAATPETASYIEDNWLSTLPMWANCSREHSALLLQVLTTNPNEAYHRSLKALAGITKQTVRPRYSLSGIISLIAQCDEKYRARAQKAAYDWSRKKLSATLEHTWLDFFPYHVQLLLLDEIKEAEKLAESGAESSLIQGKCKCRFTRSYWLPCRHVIYAWEALGEIEEPDWGGLAELFDESGFEIYTSKELVAVDDHVGAVSRDQEAKLVTNEALESIRTRFFEVVQISDSLDEDARDRLLKRWEAELADYTSAFIGRSITEWMERDDEIILF